MLFILNHVKYIGAGVILLSLQQVLAAQVHSFFIIPDLLFIYVFLLLYFSEEQSNWIFLSAFILAVIQEYSTGQIIGITPLFFLLFSYTYSGIKNLLAKNWFLIPMTFVSFLLWILFETALSFILKIEIPSYFFSYQILVKFACNLIIIMFMYFLFTHVIYRRKIKNE